MKKNIDIYFLTDEKIYLFRNLDFSSMEITSFILTSSVNFRGNKKQWRGVKVSKCFWLAIFHGGNHRKIRHFLRNPHEMLDLSSGSRDWKTAHASIDRKFAVLGGVCLSCYTCCHFCCGVAHIEAEEVWKKVAESERLLRIDQWIGRVLYGEFLGLLFKWLVGGCYSQINWKIHLWLINYSFMDYSFIH